MPKRIAHFEIHADDIDRAAKFYTEIFGWEISKWTGPDIEYWMVMTGKQGEPGGINGGLLKRPGTRPAEGTCNNAYVCTAVVDDYNQIHDKILAAGGKQAMPKFAIKGMAWQGYYIDSEGNTFGIHQADPSAV